MIPKNSEPSDEDVGAIMGAALAFGPDVSPEDVTIATGTIRLSDIIPPIESGFTYVPLHTGGFEDWPPKVDGEHRWVQIHAAFMTRDETQAILAEDYERWNELPGDMRFGVCFYCINCKIRLTTETVNERCPE